MTYTMGSLFAGIGGFDLGFERAGFKTSWQVEIDPYCQKVLAKNFPEAERFGDIRECGSHNLKPVDVICGGFPCQDISNAGLRAGIEGERSGLWKEYARIIRELRPKFVVVENVAALLGRGMGVVLGDLAKIGYDAEWEIISAADVGAPHLRERVWITAYPNAELRGRDDGWNNTQGRELRYKSLGKFEGLDKEVANALGQRHDKSATEPYSCDDKKRNDSACEQGWRSIIGEAVSGSEALAYAIGIGQPRPGESIESLHPEADRKGQASHALDVRGRHSWESEPSVGRVVDGVPVELVANELRGLGNAVVPQIPEMIATRIKQALEAA